VPFVLSFVYLSFSLLVPYILSRAFRSPLCSFCAFHSPQVFVDLFLTRTSFSRSPLFRLLKKHHKIQRAASAHPEALEEEKWDENEGKVRRALVLQVLREQDLEGEQRA